LPAELQPAQYILCVHSVRGDTVVRLESPTDYVEQYRALRSSNPQLHMCLTGHTHMPTVVHIARSGYVSFECSSSVRLRPGEFYFINPGSVGHPRGSDYRASYAIVDLDCSRVLFRRIAYRRKTVSASNSRHGIQSSPGPPVIRHRWSMLMRALRQRVRLAEG
jgi:hypothetical protein